MHICLASSKPLHPYTGMKMKKFMTTKMSAVSTTPSPTPPATFSFDGMLQRTADRNGSSTSPDTLERTNENEANSSMPSVSLPPPTPTAILSVATALSDKEVKTAKESSPARVLASATDSPSSSSSSTGVVKMCGYLKKKRNKMGGWRKLFFILQNQLLLSYSSRDDYEKKLAPFKDIINLVPGTVIIPTTGPRFTIETNSKLMYTFRCDDHRSCSEWIMALLDSLTVANGGISADRNFSLHNSFQRSTLPLSSFSLPSNCKPFAGVISRPNGPALAPKQRAPQPPSRPGPPKPPRSFSAEGTGRHGTRDEDDLNNNVLQMHEGKLLASNSLSNSRDNGTKLSGTGGNDDARRSETETRASNDEQTVTRGRTILVDRRDRVTSGGVSTAAEERNDRPKQQIFRLHQDVWSKSHHQSMDVCRINSMFNERPGVPTTIDRTSHSSDTVEESTVQTCCPVSSSGVVDNGTACNSHLYEEVGVPETPETASLETEPIYAVVDVRAKRSRRLARTLDTSTGQADDRAEGGRKVSVSLPQISDGVELVTGSQRRPVTARSCSNYDDYEDVNYLFETHRSTGGTETDSVGTGGSQDHLRHDTYGDEHIYEPIQVSDRIPSVTTGSSSSLPAPTDHHHSHSLWRQLKRMQLQGSWRRLTHRNGTTPKPPSAEPPHTRSATVTALEGLGRRFDSHRRSIKKRIKNLCERIDPANNSSGDSGPLHQTPTPEQSAPETSAGARSRKSVSLDSFLLAKGQSSVPRY
uniref:PH domain-containing protein n=1 Tax=Anopheles minimus TaxID=112268 RepID=A0A182W511_9DIPT